MGYKHLIFPEGTIVLVTGAAGFIGSNLVEALINMGVKVRGIDNLSTGRIENISEFMNHELFEFIEGDITNFEKCLEVCEGINYVLHQAAWGSVPRSIEMPVFYEEINIKGTLNMMEASKQKGVIKFVYASSSSVYGDEPTLPKKEGREGNVLSPYALTKKVNEEYGRLYKQLYNLDTYGLRYFNVFGRRQNPEGVYAAVIPKFIQMLLKDQAPTINGDGLQSRDFTYIENVIEANLKACFATSEAAGQAYNVAFGGQEYLIDIYNYLNEILGKNIKPKYAQNRAGDIKHSNADITKIKENIAYDADWDFEKGMAEAIKWYRENQND